LRPEARLPDALISILPHPPKAAFSQDNRLIFCEKNHPLRVMSLICPFPKLDWIGFTVGCSYCIALVPGHQDPLSSNLNCQLNAQSHATYYPFYNPRLL